MMVVGEQISIALFTQSWVQWHRNDFASAGEGDRCRRNSIEHTNPCSGIDGLQVRYLVQMHVWLAKEK